MEEKMLKILAAEDQFSRATIFGSGSAWRVVFSSAHSDVKYSLTLARGGDRNFKSLDAAYACALKIFDSSTAAVEVVRELPHN